MAIYQIEIPDSVNQKVQDAIVGVSGKRANKDDKPEKIVADFLRNHALEVGKQYALAKYRQDLDKEFLPPGTTPVPQPPPPNFN